MSRTTNVTPLSNVIAAAAAAGDTTSVRAAAGLPAQGQAFQSLFSDGRRGPVSDVVRDLWTTRPHVAAALSGVPAPPNVPAPNGTASAAPAASASPVAPVTPIERVQNLFNDLLSSIHS